MGEGYKLYIVNNIFILLVCFKTGSIEYMHIGDNNSSDDSTINSEENKECEELQGQYKSGERN